MSTEPDDSNPYPKSTPSVNHELSKTGKNPTDDLKSTYEDATSSLLSLGHHEFDAEEEDDDDFEYLPSDDGKEDDEDDQRNSSGEESEFGASPLAKRVRISSVPETSIQETEGRIAQRTRAQYSLHDKSLEENEETLEGIMNYYFPESDEARRQQRQQQEESEYMSFLQSLVPGSTGVQLNPDDDEDDEDYDPTDEAPPVEFMDIRVSKKELELLMREPIDDLDLPGELAFPQPEPAGHTANAAPAKGSGTQPPTVPSSQCHGNGHPFTRAQYLKLLVLVRRHMQHLIQLYQVCLGDPFLESRTTERRGQARRSLKAAPRTTPTATTAGNVFPAAVPKCQDSYSRAQVSQVVTLLANLQQQVAKSREKLQGSGSKPLEASVLQRHMTVIPPQDEHSTAIPVTRAKLAAMRRWLTPSVFAAQGLLDLSDVLEGDFLRRLLARDAGSSPAPLDEVEPLKRHRELLNARDALKPWAHRTYCSGKRLFSPEEDQLVVLGMKHYSEYDIKGIQTNLLPLYSVASIKNRIKNRSSSRANENCIKSYRTFSRDPKRAKEVFTEGEDKRLRQGVVLFGNKWAAVSRRLLPHKGPRTLEKRWAYLNRSAAKSVVPATDIPIKFPAPNKKSRSPKAASRPIPRMPPIPLMMHFASMSGFPKVGSAPIGIPGFMEYPPEMLAAMRTLVSGPQQANHRQFERVELLSSSDEDEVEREHRSVVQSKWQAGGQRNPRVHFEKEVLDTSSDEDDD